MSLRFLFPLASRLFPKSYASRLLTSFGYLFKYVPLGKASQDQPLKMAPSPIWHSFSGKAPLTSGYTVNFISPYCLPSAPLKCQYQVIKVFVFFSAVSLPLRVVPNTGEFLVNICNGGSEWWARRCLSDPRRQEGGFSLSRMPFEF